MPAPPLPAFARLRTLCAHGPVVTAHRGASAAHPENTLPAFAAAKALGVAMQEFDVHACRSGELVVIHDPGLDRTTDAAARLGPGALVADTRLAALRQLDAGRWRGAAHAGARVPTLDEVLDLLLPESLALVEHKSGPVAAYVAALAAPARRPHCILQSFDWAFVAAAKQAAPELATALLGPTAAHPDLDDAAIAAAHALGAGMLHWDAAVLRADRARAVLGAGLLLCTYTTDDELAFLGGQALGLSAMCTNEPARMLALRGQGRGATR